MSSDSEAALKAAAEAVSALLAEQELMRALTTPGSRIRLHNDKSISVAVGSMNEADLTPLGKL